MIQEKKVSPKFTPVNQKPRDSSYVEISEDDIVKVRSEPSRPESPQKMKTRSKKRIDLDFSFGKTEVHNNSKRGVLAPSKANNGKNVWTLNEHKKFIEAVRKHGKDYKKIVKHIGTRQYNSVATHAFNFKKLIRADPKHPDADILKILS